MIKIGDLIFKIMNIFSTITLLIQIIAGIYIYVKFDDIKEGLISKISESLDDQIKPLKQQIIEDVLVELNKRQR